MRRIRNVFLCSILVGLGIVSLHCGPGDDASDMEQAETTAALPVLAEVEPFQLTDQNGRAFGSDDLRGSLWIATVTFTRSRTNTPGQVATMANLHDHIAQASLGHSIHLVNFTAEPEHDTPQTLQAYAGRAGADSANWHFITGPRPEMTDVIESLGLPLLDGARTSQRPISLSPQFVLVDRQHRVRGIYDMHAADEFEAMLTDVRLLLPEAPHLDDGTGRTHLVVPPENLNLSWIDRRRREQLATASSFDVFHDFTFAHRRQESGITFRNKIVNNAGKDWMPNHYDHGNGVAIADVDGDGRQDLYFTSQVGGNELWRNTGDGHFENITDRAGVALTERIGVTASFADIDNDGDPDLYVTSVKGGNALFENDGSGRFTDISEASGTDYSGHSSSAVFFDYNRDGLLDLFLVNVGVYTSDNRIPVTNGTSEAQTGGKHSFYEGLEDAFTAHIKPGREERSILYENQGEGRFIDVSQEVGLVDESWSGDATPIDANGDGWLDLYVLNMQGDDRYYENVDGEHFVRKSEELFPNTPWGSMGVKSLDYNNDGRMDLFLTDMHSDMSENIGPEREELKSRMQWPDSLLAGGANNVFGNAFYENRGSGRFAEVSDQIGAENYWPWGLSAGDLNADGFEDVFVASSMNYPFRYGVNSVLLNNRGEEFLDSEYILGVEPRHEGQTVTPWFELDCSGEDQAHEYCTGRSGGVVVWGAVGSRSSVIFDLDDDGDLDVVTNDFNSEPLVLVSNLSEQIDDLRYLKVRLVGTESNRDGLGARVTLTAGGKTYTKVQDGVTGYLSHGIQPLYFGLGDASSVESIEVQWPSGTTQVVDGPIETNALVTIEEE